MEGPRGLASVKPKVGSYSERPPPCEIVMCGIAGVMQKRGEPASTEILDGMVARLHHRGPDGRGVRTFGSVALGHARLKVIDLSDAAAQPMSNFRQDLWVTFNGEIYNFRELRKELASRGFRFQTRSDTEVILALYEAGGLDALKRLDGMFAFAIWDQRRRKFTLGRDRTGKKPLFYYEKDGLFVFGSEMKAVLAHPAVDRSRFEAAIPMFLRHGYVPTPYTIYTHIRKLPPATFLEVTEDGAATQTRYWDLPRPSLSPESSGCLRRAKQELRGHFIRAVERRLVSDVPLGVFLSGGIDSTLVAGVMRRELQVPTRTFSVGFDGDARFDESQIAKKVARWLGADHTEFRVGANQFQVLEKLVSHYEEPYADASAIPSFLLSQLARDEVTVVLTGDGGDEVFAGYPRFAWTAMADRIPPLVRAELGKLDAAIPEWEPYDGRLGKLRRFARRAALDTMGRLDSWVSCFRQDELEKLWRGPLPSRPLRFADIALAGPQDDDVINSLLRYNLDSYLLDDLNVKMDRASMAVSLETRAPFLDTALMEFAFGLPGRYKIRGRDTKWVLQEAFRDLLPRYVTHRKKMGFGVPLGTWFRGDQRAYLAERIRPRSAKIYDYVEYDFVRQIIEEHEACHRDWGMSLTCLLSLELWLQAPPVQAARGFKEPATSVPDIASARC